MQDFDLDKFLKNHKPKKVNLSKYLETEKLQGYHEMTNKKQLKKGKTCIRFMKISDAFSNKDYDSHISYPAIFEHGLRRTKEGLQKDDDPKKWTHIVVTFSPEDDIYEENKPWNRVFRIRLSAHHIFYRYCEPIGLDGLFQQ